MAADSPHFLVPVLAEKEKLPAQASHEEQVIRRRCEQLQSFMNRVCNHHVLSQSKDLLLFLETKVWALESTQAAYSNQVGKMLHLLRRDADGAWKKIRGQFQELEDPEQDRHQNLLAYTTKLEEQTSLLLETARRLTKRQEGLGNDLADMSPTLEVLSQSEDEVAGVLAEAAKSFRASSDRVKQQAGADELYFVERLRDLVLWSTAAKELLKNREAAMCDVVALRESKMKIEREFEQVKQNMQSTKPKTAMEIFKETLTLESPKEQIRKLEEQKKECEAASVKAEGRWKQATKVTSQEMQRFHNLRVWEVRETLRGFCESQIQFHEDMARTWQSLLPKLEALPLNDLESGSQVTTSHFTTESQELSRGEEGIDLRLAGEDLKDLED
uniref:PX domain-containing protein n=1 Tax=Guillardia theta TaxID=55529 RepID=A0A7S4PR37_GUITH